MSRAIHWLQRKLLVFRLKRKHVFLKIANNNSVTAAYKIKQNAANGFQTASKSQITDVV